MTSEVFEPAIPAVNQTQTYALDRTATDIGKEHSKDLFSNITDLSYLHAC